MSATTSKTGRNAPQTGCFEDQEFRSFKGPLLEKILHEKLTVPDNTANGYLALAVLRVTNLLWLWGKANNMSLLIFCLYMLYFKQAYFTQDCSVVMCMNTILFLLKTKLRWKESAAKIFISNLRFGILPSGLLRVRYTDMSIRVLQISMMEDLEGTALSWVDALCRKEERTEGCYGETDFVIQVVFSLKYPVSVLQTGRTVAIWSFWFAFLFLQSVMR